MTTVSSVPLAYAASLELCWEPQSGSVEGANGEIFGKFEIKQHIQIIALNSNKESDIIYDSMSGKGIWKLSCLMHDTKYFIKIRPVVDKLLSGNIQDVTTPAPEAKSNESALPSWMISEFSQQFRPVHPATDRAPVLSALSAPAVSAPSTAVCGASSTASAAPVDGGASSDDDSYPFEQNNTKEAKQSANGLDRDHKAEESSPQMPSIYSSSDSEDDARATRRSKRLRRSQGDTEPVSWKSSSKRSSSPTKKTLQTVCPKREARTCTVAEESERESDSAAAATAEPNSDSNTPEADAGLPWPRHYKLPVFPRQVSVQLEATNPEFHRAAKVSLRSKMIACLMDDMTRYDRKWYPTKEQYSEVISALIDKYPFLRDSSPSGTETLRKCLMDKFKKTRRNLIGNEEVAKMKEKFASPNSGRKRKGTGDEEESIQRLKRPMRVDNLSIPPKVEDESGYVAENQWLVEEVDRADPNWEAVKEKLAQTFHYRRESFNNPLSVKESLEKFPYYKSHQVILHDFHLAFGCDLMKKLNENLPPLVPGILYHKKAKSSVFYSARSEVLEAATMEDELNEFEEKLAADILAHVSGIDETSVFCIKKNPTDPIPCVRVDGNKYSVYLENLKLVDNINDSRVAIATLFAIFWLYNIQYGKNQGKFMEFLEGCVFTLQQKVKPAARKLFDELRTYKP